MAFVNGWFVQKFQYILYRVDYSRQGLIFNRKEVVRRLNARPENHHSGFPADVSVACGVCSDALSVSILQGLDILLCRDSRSGAIANRVGHLTDQLGADITAGEDPRN